MNQENKQITLIVDGDVVAYGACPNRWGSAEFNRSLEAPQVFTLEEDNAYLEECCTNYDNIIRQLTETTFATSFRVAIKGTGNFRNDIFPEYKANRSKTVRPVNVFVEMVREHAERQGAVRAHGMEADDLLHIWHQEELSMGNLPVIASIDKDLLCIPGKHYRFPKGNLHAGSRDINCVMEQSEWDAAVHYHKQLLMGDSTDGIPGLPKIGPKKADAILLGCKDVGELQFMTIYAYKEIIGDEWEKELMLTGQLITIKPTYDFEFSLKGWKGYDAS